MFSWLGAQPDRKEALSTAHQLEYTYKRSLGPMLSGVFTRLRDRKLCGAKRSVGSSSLRVRLAQAARPVRGPAEDHQVDGANKARARTSLGWWLAVLLHLWIAG